MSIDYSHGRGFGSGWEVSNEQRYKMALEQFKRQHLLPLPVRWPKVRPPKNEMSPIRCKDDPFGDAQRKWHTQMLKFIGASS